MLSLAFYPCIQFGKLFASYTTAYTRGFRRVKTVESSWMFCLMKNQIPFIVETSGFGPEKAQVSNSSLLPLALTELGKQAEGDFS